MITFLDDFDGGSDMIGYTVPGFYILTNTNDNELLLACNMHDQDFSAYNRAFLTIGDRLAEAEQNHCEDCNCELPAGHAKCFGCARVGGYNVH